MEGKVKERYLFHIKPSEAKVIVDLWLVDDGSEFRQQVVGGRSDVGARLWETLKDAGYVTSTGRRGQYTPAVVNNEIFAQTRFVASDETRTRFTRRFKRPQDLPEQERAKVPAGKAIEDLKRIAGKHKAGSKDLDPEPTDVSTEHEEEELTPVQSTEVEQLPISYRDELVNRIAELMDEEVMLAEEIDEINHRRHKKTRRMGEVQGERRALQEVLLRLVSSS